MSCRVSDVKHHIAALAATAIAVALTAGGCAREDLDTPNVAYVATGEIHPAHNPSWCLSVISPPEPGDAVFIAECGSAGTFQQWVATRAEISGAFRGDISVLGHNLAVGGNRNERAVLISTAPGKTSSTGDTWIGLYFAPAKLPSGATAWEVSNPWLRHRALATTGTVRPGGAAVVTWGTGAEDEWLFQQWEQVTVESTSDDHEPASGEPASSPGESPGSSPESSASG